jgi:NitT/TauT family transport system permease protein
VGVHTIDARFLRAAENFGVSRFDLMRRVVLPAVLPQVLIGMRVGLGVAWLVVVAAEMIALKSGLGYLIMQARSHFNMANLFVGVIGLGLLSLGLDRLFVVIVDYALPRWSSQRRI